MESLPEAWPAALSALSAALAAGAAAHVVLNKRDAKAAIGWLGLLLFVPLLGPLLYLLLGVNRIRRRAGALRRARLEPPGPDERPCPRERLGPMGRLAELSDRVVGWPLLEGNRVLPFEEPEAAMEAMLAAVRGARRSAALSAYIFDLDRAGRRFVEALAQARGRGVEVRVLVDGLGSLSSPWPGPVRALRRGGVRAESFLPLGLTRLPHFNLRNHRKLLVVDGKLGFTGGMNLRESYLALDRRPARTRDLHFQLEGPVVRHLARAFAQDWLFAAGERLDGPAWRPEPAPPKEPAGPSPARGIPSGPDEDLEKTRWVLHGAVDAAERSLRIQTPYFLPDPILIAALNTASLSGVRVDVLLPARNDHLPVQWASEGQLWQLLERGCRVWLCPPPFDHSKLVVADEAWCLFGSSNWDPRSLRLNFEFDVECYDPALAGRLAALFDRRKAGSRELTLRELRSRPLARRLRDGTARLLSPYL